MDRRRPRAHRAHRRGGGRRERATACRFNTCGDQQLSLQGRLADWTAAGWTVSHGYFRTIGTPILEGREFTPATTGARRRLRSSAARWRGDSGRDPAAVGRELHLPRYRTTADGKLPPEVDARMRRRDPSLAADLSVFEIDTLQVIGVVEDIRAFGLNLVPSPAYYLDYRQARSTVGNGKFTRLVVRRGPDADNVAGDIRSILVSARLGGEVRSIDSMSELVARSIGGRGSNRLMMLVATLFGGLALVLTTIGIFGVMLHTVNQRLPELGIRIALGASRGNIARLVLGYGVRVLLAGLALGLTLTWAASRSLRSLLVRADADGPSDLLRRRAPAGRRRPARLPVPTQARRRLRCGATLPFVSDMREQHYGWFALSRAMAFLLALIVVPIEAQQTRAQPRPAQQATGTARIQGRVVNAETGTAVRMATVRLISPDMPGAATTSDGNGRFEFTDLPAGRFTISVAKGGFTTTVFGQPDAGSGAIVLQDGQRLRPRRIAIAARRCHHRPGPRSRSAIRSRRPASAPIAPSTSSLVSADCLPAAPCRRTTSVTSGSTASLPGKYYVGASLRPLPPINVPGDSGNRRRELSPPPKASRRRSFREPSSRPMRGCSPSKRGRRPPASISSCSRCAWRACQAASWIRAGGPART